MNTGRILAIVAVVVAALLIGYYVMAPGGGVPPKTAVGEAGQPVPSKTQ